MGAEIVGAKLAPNLKPEHAYHDGNPIQKKAGQKSVLVQTDPGAAGEGRGFPGRYVFVAEDLAADMVKAHKAVYVTPRSPDYLEGVKLALGRPDGFKIGEAIQIGGKAFRAEDIGMFDTAGAIKAAKEAADAILNATEDAAVETAALKDPASFAGKHKAKPFGR